MTNILYFFSPTDRSAKIRWLLTELGIPFENRKLNSEIKENLGPEFLGVNPMGAMPTLLMDGTIYTESAAICEFLAEKFSDGVLSVGRNEPERAEYLKWIVFSVATMEALFEQYYTKDKLPDSDRVFIESQIDRVGNTINLQLQKAVGAIPYIVASRFTAADICLCYALNWKAAASLKEKYPLMQKYFEAMKARTKCKESNAFIP
jgi:glutathione S-transferase